MRGTLVLAVLAAGTLGDKTVGFPKTSGVSIPHSEGQPYNRREIIGTSHEVTRKDEETSTCTPNSDEYYRRYDALLCGDNEYMRAVRKEIENSNCTSTYSPERSCAITDERVDINTCSEECSATQYFYLICKYLGEEGLSIDRECGVPSAVVGVGGCSFNNNTFCSVEIIHPSSNFQTVYIH